MTDSFNVFVIGPMGADKDKPFERATPISQHMANIAAALRAAMPNYRAPNEFNVISPQDLMGGDITNDVFSRIDDADLGVADITSRSPSVMYELAYFHAIGTPVIVIDDGSIDDEKRPFYLKDVNILVVKDFDITTLTTSINERLQKFFNPREIVNFSNNPITRFYGDTPLIEISGAATIARGYYKNFVRLIINEASGLKMLNDNLNIDKLYIVKPSSDLSAGRDFSAYESAFEGQSEKSFRVYGGERPRGLSAHYNGQSFFDIPRTVYTLAHSPRVQRIQRAVDNMDFVDSDLKEELLARAYKGLIDAFFRALRSSIARDENVFKNMVEFVDIDDLPEIVQRP